MKVILGMLERIHEKHVSRRGFMKAAFMAAVLAASQSFWMKRVFAKEEFSTGRKKKDITPLFDLVMAEGSDPYLNTVKAVEAMGGMEKFVKKGDVVLVKPNIGWDRNPAQAANTDPNVVAAIVEMSFKAGAKRVNVFDVTCNDPKRCYENSGIMKSAKEKGANVYYPDDWNVLKAKFSYESPMQGWPILRDAIECDTFINVPVLKSHGLTGLTLSMKNLMGVCGGNRGLMHVNIGPKLVDLTDFIKPDLTIIDAHRFMMRNGPSGGNVNDVRVLNKLIASKDPVLADVFACRIIGADPLKIPNLKVAMERKFGQYELGTAKLKKIVV